jgi:hypothetical protein
MICLGVNRLLICKMLQLGIILGIAGDPVRLPLLAAMRAVLLGPRTGCPPLASMTTIWILDLGTLLIG